MGSRVFGHKIGVWYPWVENDDSVSVIWLLFEEKAASKVVTNEDLHQRTEAECLQEDLAVFWIRQMCRPGLLQGRSWNALYQVASARREVPSGMSDSCQGGSADLEWSVVIELATLTCW